MFGQEATLPVDWVFPTPSENNVPMDGRLAGRETTCLQEYERCARRKSTAERPDVQTLNPEYPS